MFRFYIPSCQLQIKIPSTLLCFILLESLHGSTRISKNNSNKKGRHQFIKLTFSSLLNCLESCLRLDHCFDCLPNLIQSTTILCPVCSLIMLAGSSRGQYMLWIFSSKPEQIDICFIFIST